MDDYTGRILAQFNVGKNCEVAKKSHCEKGGDVPVLDIYANGVLADINS
jgi:hypothetical protein